LYFSTYDSAFAEESAASKYLKPVFAWMRERNTLDIKGQIIYSPNICKLMFNFLLKERLVLFLNINKLNSYKYLTMSIS